MIRYSHAQSHCIKLIAVIDYSGDTAVSRRYDKRSDMLWRDCCNGETMGSLLWDWSRDWYSTWPLMVRKQIYTAENGILFLLYILKLWLLSLGFNWYQSHEAKCIKEFFYLSIKCINVFLFTVLKSLHIHQIYRLI